MSTIRKKTVQGLRVGDSFAVSRTFTEEDVRDFARVTRDQNPVHFNGRFAEFKGFSGRICHGLLVAGILTEIGGQIGWLASGMDFRFKKPVYFGDTVTCTCAVTEISARLRARAKAVFTNQHGEIVLEARMTGILPGPEERGIMDG